MAFGRSAKRLSYDKLIKQALEQFHQEFELVREMSAGQQRILEQNEKMLELLRLVWNNSEKHE